MLIFGNKRLSAFFADSFIIQFGGIDTLPEHPEREAIFICIPNIGHIVVTKYSLVIRTFCDQGNCTAALQRMKQIGSLFLKTQYP